MKVVSQAKLDAIAKARQVRWGKWDAAYKKPCGFAGCLNTMGGLHGAKGLCGPHYQQQRLGKPLMQLRSRVPRAPFPHPTIAGAYAVPLTQGHVAIVDAADAALVGGFSWATSFLKGPPKGRPGYGIRTIRIDGKWKRQLLHVFLWSAWGLPLREDQELDHKNRNGLDCRRLNLRPATRAQNNWNTAKSQQNTSGFKGVSWSAGKWEARIACAGIVHRLGRFDDPAEAAKAYAEAAHRLHGEFARTT